VPRGDRSRLRPSLDAKRELDAWGRPLPLPGSLVSLLDDSVGVYVEGIGSALDPRPQAARVLIGGALRLVFIPHFRTIDEPGE